MSEFSRRGALKATAASGLVAGSAGGGAYASMPAQESALPIARFENPQERWKDHKTKDARSIMRKEEALEVSMGASPSTRPMEFPREKLRAYREGFRPMGAEPYVMHTGHPRPDLNGLRLSMPNLPEIYLIDRGHRRWIPNPATYNALFRGWEGIISDINVDQIPLGPPISSGAHLARANYNAAIYFIDRGQKRWIMGPPVMNAYYFAWNKVINVPAGLIDAIPLGPEINV